jgi:hypothetical protein
VDGRGEMTDRRRTEYCVVHGAWRLDEDEMCSPEGRWLFPFAWSRVYKSCKFVATKPESEGWWASLWGR